MSGKTEQSSTGALDSLWLLLSVALLIGGVVGYYYFEDYAIAPVRVVGLIAIVILAAFVAGQSAIGGAFFRFVKEADVERRKIVWPTHQETVQTALMVIVVTIIVSLMLAGIDWILGHIVRALVSGG